MYIMAVDIDPLKYPFSTYSQPIGFFGKESKSGKNTKYGLKMKETAEILAFKEIKKI